MISTDGILRALWEIVTVSITRVLMSWQLLAGRKTTAILISSSETVTESLGEMEVISTTQTRRRTCLVTTTKTRTVLLLGGGESWNTNWELASLSLTMHERGARHWIMMKQLMERVGTSL